ncbi:ABC transporter permease [Streptosporangiaceae bacterium NEAU-GS5]|nr:ABC transporter permease [Streptosporangiaceae bacterium NEAU-GS5]
MRGDLRRVLRLTVVGVRHHVLCMSTSPMILVFTLVTPLAYATLAFYLFRAADRPGTPAQVAVGAGLMGMWESVVSRAGGAVQTQRWLGTLETLVMAPMPLAVSLAHITLAAAIVGTYSMGATLAWGMLVFGMAPAFTDPALFVLAVAGCVVSLGMIGMLLASTLVLLRNANAVANTLDYPIYLLSGVLVPITVLPGWMQPISAVLPTTWAARAVHLAAGGGGPGEVLVPMGIGLALSLGCLLPAVRMIAWVERRSRTAATLALT